ncbi:type III secretion protein [Clostridiaceae bacterium]|nr:type III secretion protein [Clostridiaceae bacterium]RKI11640.1 type III secretion protein [bacterium 1XD21-70]
MSEFDDLMRQKAVALKYNPDKNGAPVIVASGMGYLAEKITETAMEAGVPVYEDASLATLLTQLQLGSEIPKELYQAIVDIYIYFLGYVPEKSEAPEEENAEGQEEAGQQLPGGTGGGLPEGGPRQEGGVPASPEG